jgi:hypothetical protein
VLRHTFATELAKSEVSVHTLMKLFGRESMVTSQRYVTAAGAETRTAAAQNKLYGLLAADDRKSNRRDGPVREIRGDNRETRMSADILESHPANQSQGRTTRYGFLRRHVNNSHLTSTQRYQLFRPADGLYLG